MSHRKLVDFDLKAVALHLRRVHPVKTAEFVSVDIGVPAETVRQWLRGAANPSGPALAALIGVYGLEILAAALPALPQCLKRALVAERRAAAMDEMRRLGERLEALSDDAESEGGAAPVLGGAVGVGALRGAAVRGAAVAGDQGG